MISARFAQLRDQRSQSKQLSGGIRILTGGSTATRADAIEKKTLTDELAIKTQQYNDGIIGNEAMRSYLTGLSTNSTLSEREKADIQSQIREFDDRITVSRMEAIYKNSPDNSTQKIQSAKTLANFYNAKASSLMSGTPAQSDALTKAGQWGQVVDSETTQVEKQNRALKRAQLFNKVAEALPGSIDEATQKAQAYIQLAQQARADGNETEALNYESQATNLTQQIPQIQERIDKENGTAQRKAILSSVAEYENMYRRGEITGDDLIKSLMEVDNYAAGIGDTSLQLRLTNIAQGVYRDQEKGITYSNNGEFGDKNKPGGAGDLIYDPDTGQLSYGAPSAPGVVDGAARGTGRSSNGSVATSQPGSKQSSGKLTLSQLQADYEDKVRQAHQYFIDGQRPDGKRFDSKAYITTLAVLSADRTNDLNNIVTQLKQVDPNAKIMFEGTKTKVRDLVDKFEKEFKNVSVEANQLAKGEVVPVMTYGDTTGGTVNGRPIVELKPLSSIKNLKTDYVQDSQGIYHQTKQDEVVLNTPQDVAAFQKQNPTAQIKLDPQTGAYKALSNRYVDVTDENGNRIRYEQDPNYGLVPVIPGDPTKDVLSRDLTTLKNTIIKEANDAKVSGKPVQARKPMTTEQLQTFIESGKGVTDQQLAKPSLKLTYNPTVEDKAGDLGAAIGQDIQKVGNVVKSGVIQPVQQMIENVNDALHPLPPVTNSQGQQVNPTLPKINPTMTPQQANQQLTQVLPQVKKPTPQAVAAVQKVQAQPVMKTLAPPPVSGSSAQLKPSNQPSILTQAKNAIVSLGKKLLPSFFK